MDLLDERYLLLSIRCFHDLTLNNGKWFIRWVLGVMVDGLGDPKLQQRQPTITHTQNNNKKKLLHVRAWCLRRRCWLFTNLNTTTVGYSRMVAVKFNWNRACRAEAIATDLILVPCSCSLENCPPIDEIYECTILKWVIVNWVENGASGE